MPGAVLEGDRDRVALMLDVGVDFVGTEPNGAPAFARERGIELPGDLALTFAQHVIDGGGDGSDLLRRGAARRGALEAVRKFLGDEARA